MLRFVFAVLLTGLLLAPVAANPLRLLIVDGQNNHKWKETTPVLKQILADSKQFQVDVATTPEGKDISSFAPKFSDYQVVVSNYNGAAWPEATRKAFVEYVNNGGGFVSVHAANNAFSDWAEYNRMIGVGGWGGRTEKSGPYLYLREGKPFADTSAGRGGSHGPRHPFVVETRAPEHPIMAGLPAKWLHANDELYDRLRGPAQNVTILATAYADPKKGGSDRHEPMLMTIAFGKGRVFHTTLGHDVEAMKCVGFQVTLIRGAEWAATGKVTPAPLPSDFPTETATSSRK
jgi:type 1 glutamine amidotransferase